MSRLFACALALFAGSAFADPYSIVLTQRNSADTGNLTRVMTVPTSPSLWYYDPVAELPGYVTLGTGISFSSGMLALTSIPVNADWNAVSGLAQILNKPSIPAAQVNSDWASNTGLSQILNRPTLATVATSGSWNDLNSKPTTVAGAGLTDAATTTALTSGLAGKFNTPAGTTAQYVRGDGTLATLPTAATPSPSAATRSLNTAFQISTTRNTQVSYAVDVSVTSVLLAGTQGTVTLEYADNSGMTTNLVIVASGTSATGGVLNVTNVGTVSLVGFIPAGKFVEILTTNTTGTPTFTSRAGQEVLM